MRIRTGCARRWSTPGRSPASRRFTESMRSRAGPSRPALCWASPTATTSSTAPGEREMPPTWLSPGSRARTSSAPGPSSGDASSMTTKSRTSTNWTPSADCRPQSRSPTPIGGGALHSASARRAPSWRSSWPARRPTGTERGTQPAGFGTRTTAASCSSKTARRASPSSRCTWVSPARMARRRRLRAGGPPMTNISARWALSSRCTG
mmetsp:Transcript_98503/g.275864  ORF Transcript_98503/g.275864 Transcript_98503/m.275864 type:complete len:207 (-) Transcript_98503:1520-2140(-)